MSVPAYWEKLAMQAAATAPTTERRGASRR
jgi:hypothetical protein